MPKLIYSALASLDGYIADEDGGFVWAVPDAEVLAFVNDLERPVGHPAIPAPETDGPLPPQPSDHV